MNGFRISLVAVSVMLMGAVFAIEDKCTTPLSVEQLADHWVACEGSGTSKDKAIDNALKRGISMVYGQVMTAEDQMQSSSSETTVTTPVGTASAEVTEESMASAMAKKTAGFVREYKVIYVVPDGADFLKAHVHARIINPRTGVDGVILVAPPNATIELKSDLIKVGPKTTVSGREICNIVEKALCGALAGSKHFRVCTVSDIAATAANNDMTSKLVASGMVPSSELLQAGQMLTADFILTTHLEKISYSKKLGQDKKTKKFGQVHSMKVTLGFQLTNVRTGTTAGSDTVTISLDNSEIKEMLEADEDADLLRGAFAALVKPLRGWIKKNAK